MNNYTRLKITGIKKETPDCNTYFLETTDGNPVQYKAGQFLTFVFEGNGREDRRSFSISSSPKLNEPLSVTIKKIPNGEYSRKLVDYAQAGDELVTIGASGFFTLPDNTGNYKQLFFIAAGSGITPIYSLLKTVLKSYPQINIVLIYSNRSVASSIFYEELRQLQQEHEDRFKIEWLFSNALYLEKARLGKWLLGRLLLQYSIASFNETLFYICGPYDYMRMATIELLEDGVPAQHIKKELFFLAAPEIKRQPPDTDKHLVEIISGNTSRSITVQYPDTILQAARKTGINLPYSCEAGRCGTCVALCKKGTVWMRTNEVLLDEDLAIGKILTCVGYPVNGDVTLLV